MPSARALAFLLSSASLFAGAPVAAHDVWANGAPTPPWVKAACCGPDDAHHLRPDQVHRVSDEYYAVDGYRYRIPARDALPSQDGDYWIFYRDDGVGGQSTAYCFFVPLGF